MKTKTAVMHVELTKVYEIEVEVPVGTKISEISAAHEYAQTKEITEIIKGKSVRFQICSVLDHWKEEINE